VQLSRVFHTLKYLETDQIYHLIKHRILGKSISYKTLDLPQIEQISWNAPLFHLNRWEKNRFSFMGISREIIFSQNWRNEDCPMLWRYNLHYLDDLDSIGSSLFQIDLIRSWIANNNLKTEMPWDPYVVSLRVVNIIKWMSRHKVHDPEIIDSLWAQGNYLLHNIEYHLQANHLFANIKALLFLGSIFKESFSEFALTLLRKELPSQFLIDGCHYERSPMYQGVLLRDLFDIYYLFKEVNLEAPDIILKLEEIIPKAKNWYESFLHDDGEVSYFNDSVIGVSPSKSFFDAYWKFLGGLKENGFEEKLNYFDPSGFLHWKEDCWMLLADVGVPGPNKQPGHSHAEINSFELSVKGQRLIVNTGVSIYEVGKKRIYQRSTLAHNSVSVMGLNSSDVWSSFRLGKRVKNALTKSDQESFVSTHDGFLVQGFDCLHERKWSLKKGSLEVSDILIGKENRGEATFYFHPNFYLRRESGSLQLEGNGLKFEIHLSGEPVKEFIEPAYYCKGFGQEEENQRLRVLFRKELFFLIKEII
jgi:uncharacterized heparinase superfamily protein